MLLSIATWLLAFSRTVLAFDVPLLDEVGLISPEPCTAATDFLILVHTAPDHQELRSILRSTWTEGFKTVFFIGRSTAIGQDGVIKNEATANKDIFFYDRQDSYANMTTKHVVAYAWAVANCPDAKFVLKTDDDVFVDTYHLINYLPMHGFNSRPVFYLCWVLKDQKVERSPNNPISGKWYLTHEEYGEPTFPTYCAGPAFVTTIRTMEKVLEAVKTLKAFFVDDAFVTGVAARKAGNIPFYDWSYNFLEKHIDKREELIDPNNGFFTPELIVAWNEQPAGIKTLHQKALTCEKYSFKCYQLLWKMKDPDFEPKLVKDEL